MKIPNIEDYSLVHSILRPFLDVFHDYIFNQRHYKLNLENLPKQGPALVVFTHQCALMDSMMILSLSRWQPVHISRADLFKPKLQRKFLFFLKMMPVFRVRDGFRNVRETMETFEKAAEIFRKKKFIIIAPEANHVPKRRLRVLSKGFARMAFLAEEKNDFQLGLKIVPVGLHYEDYYSTRISVVSNVGEPIEFDDLFDLYKKDEQKALLTLRDRVAEAMKKLIIHIEDLDKYEECDLISRVGMWIVAEKQQAKIRNEKDRFLFEKQVVDKLRDEVKSQEPQKFEQIINAARNYLTFLKNNKLHDFVVRKDASIFKLALKGLWYLFTLPIALYGALLNLPIYYVPQWMTRKIQEESFHTSVRFVHYWILYPLYYLVLFFLAGIWVKNIAWRLAFIVSLPIAGVWAISWFRGVAKWFMKWRFRFSPYRDKLKNARQQLVNLLKEVL